MKKIEKYYKKYKSYLLEIGLVLFLLLVTISLAFAKNYNEDRIIEERTQNNIAAAKAEHEAKNVPNEKSTHKITLTINDEERIIAESNFIPNFYIFNNYMYLNLQNKEKWGYYLTRVNLETGDDELLVEATNENRVASVVDKYYEINSDLVIIMSGYMERSRLFVVDDVTNEFTFKENLFGNKIEEINNNHYLISSFGDGCGGNLSYLFLDTSEYTSQFIKEFGIGCGKGPMELTVADNKIIFVEREEKENSKFAGDFKLTTLKEVSLLPNFEERTLIGNLPENTKNLLFDDNKIYIIADSVWEYNIDTGAYFRKFDLPDIFNDFQLNLNENKDALCASIEPTFSYKIMLSDGSYAVAPCKVASTNPYHNDQQIDAMKQVEKAVQEKFKDFDFSYNIKYYINGERVPLHIY